MVHFGPQTIPRFFIRPILRRDLKHLAKNRPWCLWSLIVGGFWKGLDQAASSAANEPAAPQAADSWIREMEAFDRF